MSLGGTTLLKERAAAAGRFQQIAAKDPKPRRCALDNTLRIRTASEIFRGTQPKLTLPTDNSAHASHNKRTITIRRGESVYVEVCWTASRNDED